MMNKDVYIIIQLRITVKIQNI